jgi:AcrR family transcriptional regulator
VEQATELRFHGGSNTRVLEHIPVPVHVDHAARRAHLAHAVWRIVARDGVAEASVRAVAREASLSMGSVRHFFASQDELLVFAVEELIAQARERIAASTPARLALLAEGRPLDAVAALLEEVLPLDAVRRTEAQVWASFTTPPVTNPRIAETREQVDDGVHELCTDAIEALHDLGRLPAERDRRIEIERLHALLDGLTIHLMVEPARISPDRARQIVLTHVGELSTIPTS